MTNEKRQMIYGKSGLRLWRVVNQRKRNVLLRYSVELNKLAHGSNYHSLDHFHAAG